MDGHRAEPLACCAASGRRSSRFGRHRGLAPLGDGRDWSARLLALHDLRRKIRPGLGGEPRAELIAQGTRLDLLDRAVGQLTELERTERHPDQTIHLQPERAQHVSDLAVLALAHRERDPDVRALHAVERRFDRAVVDAVDRDAVLEFIELVLRHLAEGAHAVAPQPAGRRQLQRTGEPAVVGEQQQSFGVQVEPADADQPRQAFGQRAEDGRAAVRVSRGGDQPTRLVEQEDARSLALRQGLAVDADAV